MNVRVVTNLPDFQAKMRGIGRDLQFKTARNAAAAASVFRGLVKQLAPVMPSSGPGHNRYRTVGALRNNVYQARTFKGVPRGTVRYFVSIRSGRRVKRGPDPFYWRWVDQGHVIARRRIQGGRNTKALTRRRLREGGSFVEGRFFLRRAFDAGQSKALQVFYQRVDRDVARYNK